eukprot:TRINITY_DN19626_c0_g1_i1.p1 TRINITY_DN19626_c0_g1~~TRINITY_DN19626_c0_g1_i1.p1  ORF type:complete len:198 (+),score=42.94 TRINITY_DN19626_c0_g1_i1:66-596(+)
MSPTENWANDFVDHLLSLAEAVGEKRQNVLFLKSSTLESEWADWSGSQIQSLIKILAGRRLISRVAGYDGEELRVHPEARKMHSVFVQRLCAFEEEEEANFVEEELEAERLQEIVKAAAAAKKQPIEQPVPSPAPSGSPQKRVPPAPPAPGVVSVSSPSVQSLRRMFGGDDIRVKS